MSDQTELARARQAFYEDDDLQQALVCYDRVIAHEPAAAALEHVFSERGDLLVQLERLPEALASFEAQMTHRPEPFAAAMVARLRDEIAGVRNSELFEQLCERARAGDSAAVQQLVANASADARRQALADAERNKSYEVGQAFSAMKNRQIYDGLIRALVTTTP